MTENNNAENNPVTVSNVQGREGVTTGKPRKIASLAGGSQRFANFGGFGGGFGNVSHSTSSNFYSAQLSTDFLELPQTDEQRWGLFRHFYDNDPFVSQAIDLLDELPLSKIRLRKPQAKNPAIARASLRFCEAWAKRIGLLHRLLEVTHEWNLLGLCHLFVEDATPEMPLEVTHERVGLIDEKGEPKVVSRKREDAQKREVQWLRKNYKGWTALRVLPPEQVTVESFPYTDQQIVSITPDLSTKKLITQADQGDPQARRVVSSMPEGLIDAFRSGQGVSLNTDENAGSFYCSLMRKKSQYDPTGKSILQRCLRTLIFRDKIRQSLTSIASRHMTPFRLVYSEDLSSVQLDELRGLVDLALQDPDFSIVTNYQVHWEEMGADQRLPDWSWVFDMTDRQMYAGLGVTESLLSGESSYQGDRLPLEVLNTRFMLMRQLLQNLVEEKFFKPMCARMGFVEEDDYGNLEVIVPSLSFTRLSFRDNTETYDALFNLYQKGSLDVGTILEHLNLDPEVIAEKLKRDFASFNDETFNEIKRSLYSRAGDDLAENSDFADKIAKVLGLSYRKPAPEGSSRFASNHNQNLCSEG